jgi:Hint domain
MFIERRRPGRTEYENPHLIPLLRHPGATRDGKDDQPDEAIGHDDIGPNPDEIAGLSDTISLFDGACQVGSPDMTMDQEQDPKITPCGPDQFLADQACYVAGVGVATADGTIASEELTPGDLVRTLSGGRRVIGTRRLSLNPADEPNPELAAAVFIRRHAFTNGLPGRDIWVSATHCVAIENHLIPARLLINGMTVVQDPHQTAVEYCHVLFDQPALEQPDSSADVVASIRHRMTTCAEHLGYNAASAGGTADLGLHLLVDGKPVLPVEINRGRHAFVVPSGPRELQLAARWDVAVVNITTISGDIYDVVPADHPGLLRGWGPCQRQGDRIWRCIVGPACLPTSPTEAARMIVVHTTI